MVKVKAEIPSYLVKFLEINYGMNFKAKRSSALGNILMDYLQKDFVRPKIENEADVYVFYLSDLLAKKYGSFIHPENYKKLIKDLDSLFQIAMNAYVNITVNSGLEYTRELCSNLKQTRYAAFQQFLNYHNILEEDLKFESVYRNDQRRQEILRNQNKKPKSTPRKKPNKKAVKKIVKIGRKKTIIKNTAQKSLF
jgi:hypothetical protein